MNKRKSRFRGISEKVIRYADDEMNDEKKIEFAEELNHSLELQKELETYLMLLSEIDGIKNLPVDEDYYTSMIPRFRLNRQKKLQQKLIPKFALAGTLALAVILFFLMLNIDETHEVTPDIAYSRGEIDSLLVYYPGYPADLDSAISYSEDYAEAVETIFIEELSLSEITLNSFASSSTYSSYENILTEVEDDEVELIYKEIINKRLF